MLAQWQGSLRVQSELPPPVRKGEGFSEECCFHVKSALGVGYFRGLGVTEHLTPEANLVTSPASPFCSKLQSANYSLRQVSRDRSWKLVPLVVPALPPGWQVHRSAWHLGCHHGCPAASEPQFAMDSLVEEKTPEALANSSKTSGGSPVEAFVPSNFVF